MQQNGIKCYRSVGGHVESLLCKAFCIKYGKTGTGKQRYKCKNCGKTYFEKYKNQACLVQDKTITALLKESPLSGASVLPRAAHM